MKSNLQAPSPDSEYQKSHLPSESISRVLLTGFPALLAAAAGTAMLLWIARTTGFELGGICTYGRVKPQNFPYGCFALCWTFGLPPAFFGAALMLFTTDRIRARRTSSLKTVTPWDYIIPAFKLTALTMASFCLGLHFGLDKLTLLAS
jgi:hypothetical protein